MLGETQKQFSLTRTALGTCGGAQTNLLSFAFRTLLELNPNFRPAHGNLGSAYLMKQMCTEAITEFQGDEDSGDLGLAYGLSGRMEEARKVLDELTSSLQQGRRVQYDIALAYVGLGEREKALDCLEKALEAQDPGMNFLKVEPLWKDLRSEPRFIALLKKMGLEK